MINASLKNAKILIVDDHIANIELLEGVLEQAGYNNTLSTIDPREVVGLYDSFQPDLILLDLMMPYMDGYEVMEKLHQIIPPKTYLPILVITAEISSDAKKQALSHGAKDFLSKPFDIDEVILRIRNLLETRYLHQLLQKQNRTLESKVLERTRELNKAYQEIMIANRELEMLENAKLEFLSIISHEIRTPLNGIKGLTEILKNSIDKPDLLEYLNYLEQSARRLEKFSTQALLITELRTKVYRMEFDNVSIASLYTNATKNNEIKIKEKNVRVEYLRDADLLGINGDSNLIQICFDCLIDNAVEYSAKNSEVLVHTYKDENSITIEFTDNGVGFSKIALKNLFRFFRVGEKHIDKNIGLNLALVKLIMDAHKGEIKVVNNKPNGATVKLIFRN